MPAGMVAMFIAMIVLAVILRAVGVHPRFTKNEARVTPLKFYVKVSSILTVNR